MHTFDFHLRYVCLMLLVVAGNQEFQTATNVRHTLPPLHAVCSRDGVQLDTIGGLLDVGLFVHVLLAGTVLHVSWSFGLRMFRVFQTEVNV